MAPNFLANDFSDFYNYDLQAKQFVINKSIDLHSSYVWKKARTSEYLESFWPVYDLFNHFFHTFNKFYNKVNCFCKFIILLKNITGNRPPSDTQSNVKHIHRRNGVSIQCWHSIFSFYMNIIFKLLSILTLSIYM